MILIIILLNYYELKNTNPHTHKLQNKFTFKSNRDSHNCPQTIGGILKLIFSLRKPHSTKEDL